MRFVVDEIHEVSNKELGVFQAAWNLRVDGKLYPDEEEQLDVIRRWFNENLEKPARFTVSKPPFYRKKRKAISWFKDSALEHIAYVRSMIAILENHGVSVRMLTTDRVGYVAYEDDYQIVAEPFTGERY
ncbi:MAG: hypothetical protein ABSA32_00275 [Candidatus Acidiferrales bacterium]